MVFMHTYQQCPQVIVFCECETDVTALPFSAAPLPEIANHLGRQRDIPVVFEVLEP